MDELKSLASMELGEEGFIVQILGDRHIYHNLSYLGFEVGAHVIVLSRMKIGIAQVPCLSVSLGPRTIVLPETEAAKVIVKVKRPERISYFERPDIWRPVWPFFPHWGAQ